MRTQINTDVILSETKNLNKRPFPRIQYGVRVTLCVSFSLIYLC